MNIDATAFRPYDIRGKAGSSIDDNFATLVGKAYGTMIAQLSGATTPKIAVGMDDRLSSPSLQQHLIEGLTSVGCDVLDIGLSTTPLMYFTTAAYQLDGGINVTASHNPPDENGFKPVEPTAKPFSPEQIQGLLHVIQNDGFRQASTGKVASIDPVERYHQHLRQVTDFKRSFNAVVDCGNGVGGKYCPAYLKTTSLKVTELHCNLDGTFPNHLPDPPMPSNVVDLQAKVRETGADLGIAFDGDADRLGIIDETGYHREADYILMLLARELLSRKPGATILCDVKTSQGVVDDITAHGGNCMLYKTGHSIMKLRMRADDIFLGGENSGHLYFKENYFCDDALYAVCKLLSYASTFDQPLSQHFDNPPKWFTSPETKITCPDAIKYSVVASVTAELSKKYQSLEIDGIRCQMKDGWALVRASNTGPNLTLRFEATSEARMEEIGREITDVVNQQIEAHAAKAS
jgi:phosphomannomutase/phosphoglucomutase